MTSAPVAPAALAEPPVEPPPSPREPFLTRVKLILRPSNFIAAVPGPIFNKDVWISGRKAGTYWIRFVYVILLLFTISMVFAAASDDLTSVSSPTLRLQQLQQVAPITTKVLLWFVFITLSIVGVILGAPTICEEKRAGTLATLLTTPLKAWQVVIGKTCAFFVQLAILAFVAAPLLLAVRVFGGVGAEEVIAGTVLILANALLGGLCGMLFSVNVRRTAGAIMGGLLLLVFIQGAVPLAWGLTALYYKAPVLPQSLLLNASTPAAMGMVTFAFDTVEVTRAAWVFSTLYTLGVSLLLIIIISAQLRRVMAREGEGGSAIPAGKKPKVRKGKGSPIPAPEPTTETLELPANEPVAPDPSLPNFKPRRRRASSVQEGETRTVGDHPVFWREMRQAVFRTRWPFIILTLAVGAMLSILYANGGLDEEVAHVFVTVVASILTLLGAAFTPSSIISGEREARTLDVLLTTPLSAQSIIFGKAAGAMRRQWMIPALLAAHYVIAVVARVFYDHQTLSPSAFLWALLILIPAMFFMTATGTLMSLVCKKSAGAAAASFGIAIAVWGIIPGLISLMIAFLTRGRGSGEIFSVIWSTNPVVTLGCAIYGAASGNYQLMDLDAGVSGMLVTAVIIGSAYTGLAYLILRWAASILAIRTARLK